MPFYNFVYEFITMGKKCKPMKKLYACTHCDKKTFSSKSTPSLQKQQDQIMWLTYGIQLTNSNQWHSGMFYWSSLVHYFYHFYAILLSNLCVYQRCLRLQALIYQHLFSPKNILALQIGNLFYTCICVCNKLFYLKYDLGRLVNNISVLR